MDYMQEHMEQNKPKGAQEVNIGDLCGGLQRLRSHVVTLWPSAHSRPATGCRLIGAQCISS